jgi:hypothetical protein
MPPDSQSGSGMAMMAALAGKGGVGLGSPASDLLGMKSSGALFTDIMRSRTVEDRLIDRFDLRKVYDDRYWQDARKHLAKYTYSFRGSQEWSDHNHGDRSRSAPCRTAGPSVRRGTRPLGGGGFHLFRPPRANLY